VKWPPSEGRRLARIASAVVVAGLVLLSPAAAQTDRDNAESVATAWLRGIDGGDLSALYDQYGGPTLRQGLDKQQFIEQAGIIRIQTGGPATMRTLVGDQEFHQTPTGQRGTFHYFRYRARFPSGSAVFEDVYLEMANGGWKVAGVWLRPAQ
jgi:hypothetical protein